MPISAQSALTRWKNYSELAKGGIVFLVLYSAIMGFLAGWPLEFPFDWEKASLLGVGIVLLSGGSAALNQIQEHPIDARMKRTQNRPLPSGRISQKWAVVFVVFSLTAGIALLSMTHAAVVWLGVLAVLTYNGLYTLWWKKKWAFAAIPGAIPGALPIWMGYVAASENLFAPGGIYLFFLQFFWQMPHFWALAIRYSEDYKDGGIPTLPVILGKKVTINHIVIWTLGFIGLTSLAPLFLDLGIIYLVIATGTNLMLLSELRKFAFRSPETGWLRFFLWVNFSLMLDLLAVAIDLWSIYLHIPLFADAKHFY